MGRGKATAEQKDFRQSFYRPDIDGLRALAVVAVIIHHFNKDFLPSGYLGVDIFFVISGFVITTSLAYRPSENLGDFLLGFYVRRIKRLVPALVVCVVVTSILICLFDPTPIASLRVGISSLFGLSNLYLLKQATDYFGSWAELNVFSHTWSLGVEEQFYLVFPLLVWFSGCSRRTAKGSRILFWLVVALAITSFIAFIYLNDINQPAAYFLMPTRLWELSAGCLLFLALQSGTVQEFPSNFQSLAVIGLLIASLFIPIQFSVQATIIIVLLTAALIASLRRNTVVYSLLAHPRVAYLGLISYSLYLWHWSVISISRWTIGIEWWSVPIQVALMVLLAVTSYHYLEKPLRLAKWSSAPWKSIGYGLGASFCSAILLGALLSFNGRLYTGEELKDNADSVSGIGKSNKQKRGTLLLIGDSHAGHFWELAKEVADELNMNSIVISQASTIFPTVNFSSPVGGLTRYKNHRDNELMEKMVDSELRKLDPEDDNLILLSSFYSCYFGNLMGVRRWQKFKYYLDTGEVISRKDALNRWVSDLEIFSKKNRSIKIIVFLSTPEMPNIYPERVCSKEWFRSSISDKCHVRVLRKNIVRMDFEFDRLIIEKASKLENILIFDPLSSLCPKENEFCESHYEGYRLYSDEDHLTKYGVYKVKRQLLGFLKENSVKENGAGYSRDRLNS